MRISKLALLAVSLLSSVPMFGSTLIYNSANGYAKAAVDISGTTLTITLTDLVVNPTSVGQDISGFFLNFSANPTAPSGVTSSGLERTVNDNGSYVDGSIVATGWAVSNIGAAISLNDLGAGAAGPLHTIIGAPGAGNNYSNGNGSITGNGPHNPFLDQTATWSMTISDLPSLTVTGATFQFGTTAGTISTGAQVASPEPTSLALFGIGAVLLAVGRKRLAHK